MKHLFVINPVAGKYNHAEELRPRISQCMAGRGEEFEIVITEYPLHASKIVRERAAAGGQWRVYACGGDGTLSEAADGAAGLSNVALTHYPCGTGNDFIKLFGAGAVRFTDLASLIDGQSKPVDLIACDSRHCINICSVGFDARIAASVARYKRLPFIKSKGAYNLALIDNLFRGLHYPYKVSIDGKAYDGRYTMLVACNGRYYGGGFNPVPEAMPDDGMIDFLLVGALNPFTVARVVGKYQSGHYRELPQYLTYVRGRSMQVECDRPNQVNIDGETLCVSSIRFSVSDKRLNFIVPRGLKW